MASSVDGLNQTANQPKNSPKLGHWSAGGDVRLQAFQKYMQAGCNAGAVECFMRYQRSWEEEDRDSAVYVTFAELVEKHKGDQAAALELASKRRLEKDGTGLQ